MQHSISLGKQKVMDNRSIPHHRVRANASLRRKQILDRQTGAVFSALARYQLFQSEFRISDQPGARLEAIIFQNPGKRAYSPTSFRLNENLG